MSDGVVFGGPTPSSFGMCSKPRRRDPRASPVAQIRKTELIWKSCSIRAKFVTQLEGGVRPMKWKVLADCRRGETFVRPRKLAGCKTCLASLVQIVVVDVETFIKFNPKVYAICLRLCNQNAN